MLCDDSRCKQDALRRANEVVCWGVAGWHVGSVAVWWCSILGVEGLRWGGRMQRHPKAPERTCLLHMRECAHMCGRARPSRTWLLWDSLQSARACAATVAAGSACVAHHTAMGATLINPPLASVWAFWCAARTGTCAGRHRHARSWWVLFAAGLVLEGPC